MSLNAPLVEPLDIEVLSPAPPLTPTPSCSCSACVSCCQSCWDRVFWLFSFGLSLVGIAMGLLGVFTDVSTIYAYFSHGDLNWGILATVFTGVGWVAFGCCGACFTFYLQWGFSYDGDHVNDTPFSSELLEGMSARTFGILSALQLQPALYQLDAAAFQWENGYDWGQSAKVLSTTKMFESFVKTVPLLILHAYILLINQLSSHYTDNRLTGLDRLSQIGSVASGVYFLAPCYVSWLKLDDEAILGSCRKHLFTLFFAVDTTVRVLRITVLASCVHWWSALGLAAAVLLLLLVACCVKDHVGGWFALTSPVSSALLFSSLAGDDHSDDSPSPVFPLLDAAFTVVMLVVPFTMPPHPYVHLHGVCSSLSDVNAGGNCFPLPLVASVAALVLLHWVLFATLWCLSSVSDWDDVL